MLLSSALITFRPLLGPASCKFSIGCTDYSLLQLRNHSLITALKNIVKRLIACHPF